MKQIYIIINKVNRTSLVAGALVERLYPILNVPFTEDLHCKTIVDIRDLIPSNGDLYIWVDAGTPETFLHGLSRGAVNKPFNGFSRDLNELKKKSLVLESTPEADLGPDDPALGPDYWFGSSIYKIDSIINVERQLSHLPFIDEEDGPTKISDITYGLNAIAKLVREYGKAESDFLSATRSGNCYPVSSEETAYFTEVLLQWAHMVYSGRNTITIAPLFSSKYSTVRDAMAEIMERSDTKLGTMTDFLRGVQSGLWKDGDMFGVKGKVITTTDFQVYRMIRTFLFTGQSFMHVSMGLNGPVVWSNTPIVEDASLGAFPGLINLPYSI